MAIDLTTGKPSSVLLKFSLPLLLSVVFQQMYNMVDSIVAGKFAGMNALAAVGASFPITAIFVAIATGFSAGSSVIISQYYGAKKIKEMKTCISTSIITVFIISIFFTLLGLISCTKLLHLLDTPTEVFVDSKIYLDIYVWGLIFLFFYNICNGVFTAIGDSKTPLFFLIASSIGNIILDILFVATFQMGVAGVAWATFICQGIAAILATVTLLIRFSKMQKEIVFPYFSLDMLHKIGSIAIPSILQNSFVSVGNLFIQRLINSYGAIVMAAYSSVIKLNTFVLVSISTFANGLSSFTAQNMGAGKIERIKQGYKDTVKIGMIVAILIGLFFFSCSDFLIGLFLSDSKEVKDVLVEGRVFIRILAIFYIVVSVKLITDGVLKGAGAMKQFMIATFSDLLLRVALSYLFARGFALGTLGIWLSWPVGWIIGAILSFYYYKKDTWCKQNLIS